MKNQIFLLSLLVLSTSNSSGETCIDYPELEFFNTISGVLKIELSEKAKSMENLPGNLIASKSAKILDIKLKPEIFIEETGEFRSLTEEELGRVSLNKPVVNLLSLSQETVQHKSKNGKNFTVKELLDAVELTEKKTRSNSEWFGGVDIHHIYYEGLYCENEKRVIYWGS